MEKTMAVYHQILTLPLFTAEDGFKVEAFIIEVEEKYVRWLSGYALNILPPTGQNSATANSATTL
jgi:hypothetical protein